MTLPLNFTTSNLNHSAHSAALLEADCNGVGVTIQLIDNAKITLSDNSIWELSEVYFTDDGKNKYSFPVFCTKYKFETLVQLFDNHVKSVGLINENNERVPVLSSMKV